MTEPDRSLTVDIRPGVKILSVLSHLNYKPWFAVAEFVDNAIQSFIDYRGEIEKIEGTGSKLKVEIEWDSTDGGRLIVRDNAAGIHEADYGHAFRPAAIPVDRSGLCEFGMGMKSAACWFSPYWSVRTSAISEPVERTISFDVERILEHNLEELLVDSRPIASNTHFTEIILSNLHKPPQTKTITKIKEHLSSIYRIFIREGILELCYNGQVLSYPEVNILQAPLHTGESPKVINWHKEIAFDFGGGLSAKGFAAIRETASTSEAGFALFRRNRVIEGSGDETYRPHFIFGRSNSYRYQRIFGELHLNGFSVSHTKDGFQWDESEQAFLELLKEHLDADPLPLLKQAEGYRVLQRTKDLKSGAETSTQRVARTIQDNAPKIIEKQIIDEPEQNPPPLDLPVIEEPVANKKIRIEVFGDTWEITIELSNDPAVGDWINFSEQTRVDDIRQVNIRLSLAHPFMIQFGGLDAEQIEPLQRVAVAIVLSEITARESGVRDAGTFRRNINELLRDALSKT